MAVLQKISSCSSKKTVSYSSHTVESMHTFKMEQLKEPSGMFKSKPESLSSMVLIMLTKVVDLSLWPYVVCYAVFHHNLLLSKEDVRFRLEVFGKFSLGHKLSYCHTFGSPVSTLQNVLQGDLSY